MVNQLVSLEEFKADFDNSFSITSSRWETDCPLWLVKAIEDLSIPRAFPITTVQQTIVDYTTNQPEHMLLLLAIEIDGEEVTKVDYIHPTEHYFKVNGVRYDISSYPIYYSINKNGVITYTVESGSTTLTFHTIGDANNNPVIPNIHSVIEACKFYILRKLLQYGYKHPIYNLDSNNPYTNVNIIYEGEDRRGGLKRIARSDATVIDHNIRRDLSNMNPIKAALAGKDRSIYNHIS